MAKKGKRIEGEGEENGGGGGGEGSTKKMNILRTNEAFSVKRFSFFKALKLFFMII